MLPARKLQGRPVAGRSKEPDVPLSASARAALHTGLESARIDLASGRPLTPWGDFTEYAVEDDE
jgi:hypothetical protein